jgi:hypothetical protein
MFRVYKVPNDVVESHPSANKMEPLFGRGLPGSSNWQNHLIHIPQHPSHNFFLKNFFGLTLVAKQSHFSGCFAKVYKLHGTQLFFKPTFLSPASG